MQENLLEYNTQRTKIVLSQYGRNIQKLVEYAMQIKDREKRNKAAREIIEAMAIINPEIKKMDNYEKILWDHLAIISDYKLDVDYPYPIIKKEKITDKPEPVPYERPEIKYKNYGRIVEKLIEKVINTNDKTIKEELIKLIAITMKKIHIEWFKEVVQDEVIFNQLYEMSHGKLKVPEGFTLPHTNELKNLMRNNPQTGGQYKKKKR